MKVKNPIRTYLHYNGSEMVAIASEPAGCGVTYVGYKIYDKIEEKKLEELRK